MIECFTTYKKPVIPCEQNTGEILVETAGYIPRHKRIEALQMAGVRLQQFREASYMYPDNSIAEKDDGMPSDVFMDKLEAADAARELSSAVSEKAKKATEQADAERSAATGEGTPATEPSETAKPNGPED